MGPTSKGREGKDRGGEGKAREKRKKDGKGEGEGGGRKGRGEGCVMAFGGWTPLLTGHAESYSIHLIDSCRSQGGHSVHTRYLLWNMKNAQTKNK